jgi:hypothetical protein
MKNRKGLLLCFALFLTAVAPTMMLAKSGDGARVQFFQSIDVGPDEQVGDTVCIVCSIHVAGTTSGDAVAILGSVVVDGSVAGDAVAVGGGIKLGEDANVSGSTVGIGGGVSRHPNAVVKGDVVSQSGPGVFLGLFIGAVIVPLLPIVLIIWLIVWLVRRDRQVAPAPVGYRR